MSVIPLTLFFSLILSGLFIALFAGQQRRRRFTSAESDSLLPLAEELPRMANLDSHPPSAAEPDLRAQLERVAPSLPAPAHSHDGHDGHDDADQGRTGHVHSGHTHGSHEHDDANCGCRSGKKAPCPGCLKRPSRPTSASLPSDF